MQNSISLSWLIWLINIVKDLNKTPFCKGQFNTEYHGILKNFLYYMSYFDQKHQSTLLSTTKFKLKVVTFSSFLQVQHILKCKIQ